MQSLPIPRRDAGTSAIRAAFLRNGYTTARMCERLGIELPTSPRGAENGDLRSPWRRTWNEAVARHARARARDGLDPLIRLFDVSTNVPRADLSLALSDSELALLEASELVTIGEQDVSPRMRLTEVNGLLLVTDTDETAIEPIVGDVNPYAMPAYIETFLFAGAVPRNSIRRGLDVCTGSGVHALLMARHAEQVIGTDVSARALEIARFNAALNGIENVEFRVGSLWDPLGNMTFDCITSNPPYQPDIRDALGKNWWGAGVRGESLWVPLVQGLSRRLEPNGAAHLIMQGLSWPGDPFLDRVRALAGGLDVTWNALGEPDITDYRARYPEQILENVTRVEYGVLAIRRLASVS